MKLVITHEFPKEILTRHFGDDAHIVLAATRTRLKTELRDADALMCLLTDLIDERLLKTAARLRCVGNVAVGVNNIDLSACARRRIGVVNTPGVLTQATAELTLALLLAASKRVPEGERLARSGRWKGWSPDQLLGQELHRRHAVIVGAGRIGKRTAQLMRAFGIRVTFITRRDTAMAIRRKLVRAQILSLHLPLTSETRHWLDRDRLACLPPDAIVLNTSRGPVVDEKALLAALRARRIFAAGLDVYEQEPRIPSSLRKLSNVVLLPHLGSATQETRRAMAELAAQGISAVLSGKAPPNLVKSSS